MHKREPERARLSISNGMIAKTAWSRLNVYVSTWDVYISIEPLRRSCNTRPGKTRVIPTVRSQSSAALGILFRFEIIRSSVGRRASPRGVGRRNSIPPGQGAGAGTCEWTYERGGPGHQRDDYWWTAAGREFRNVNRAITAVMVNKSWETVEPFDRTVTAR